MCRKLISMLLIIGLLAGFCVFPVSAADMDHTDHCVCGGTAEGVYDHVCADVQWQPLPEGTTDFGKLPSGNYYLTGDVAVTAASNITAGKQLSICLGGHNITSSASRVFGYTLKDSVLNICDCSGTADAQGNWAFDGTVTAGTGSGKYGCVLYTMAKSKANIFGGNFTSLSTNAANGSVFLAANDSCGDLNGDGKEDETDRAFAEVASTLSFYGGNIYSSVSTTGNGGTVGSFHNPTINIHGGKISGGESKSGGGNVYSSGTLNITGGTITGGSAATLGGNIRIAGSAVITGGTISDGVAGNNGGNIYCSGALTISDGLITGGSTQNYQGGNIYCSGTKLTVTGGTITGGNPATAGGGIYVTNAVTTNISGNPVIDGNARGNLYMARNCPATIGQLTEGAKVGILYADTWHKVTVTHSPTADVTNYIFSDSPEAYFTFSGTTMKQTAKSEEYIAGIKTQEYFDNTLEEALPMTVIYKLIDDHFAAELPAGKTAKKAIIIGYDAVRTDALKNVEDQNSAVLAVGADGGLYHSYAGGEYGGETQQMTVTSVGWTSMFTGFFARTHGVTANHSSAINAGVHTIFTKLAEQGLDVLLIGPCMDKTKKDADGNYVEFFPEHWVAEIAYQETKELPVTYYQPEENEANAMISIIGQTDMPDLTWLYMGEPDVQGHAMSWGNHIPEYVEAVKTTDADGYNVYEAIKARPTYAQEDWLVLVTTDHGGYLTQHGEHSAQERSTWIASNKAIDYTAYADYDRINEETVSHSHCVCGLGAADHECEIENWTPWYASNNLPTGSGNYYLMTDVDLSEMTGKIDLAIGVRQKLCLNGHTITGPKSDISVWWVRNYLSICDCVGTGKIDLTSNLAGPLLHVFSSGTVSQGLGGTFELYGGTVTSTGKATDTGGGIIFIGNSGDNEAIFNMYGGILQGGRTVNAGGAVNVGSQNARFNMYGGIIRDCAADTYGGAVYVGSTTRRFNMYGGTIENCTAPTCGGNVYAYGEMNIYGGTIKGGISGEGGNLGIGGNGVVTQYSGTITEGGYKDATVTTNKGGNVMLFGTYKLYGGTVENGKSLQNAGNICTYNAAGFEIKKTADSITDPMVRNGQSKYGGNIYIGGTTTKPAYTIGDGATITGGTTTSGGEGGNIWIGTYYTLNMYGGTIENGGSSTNTSQGGNLFLYGVFNMYGGTVKDGTVSGSGGNISGWSSYTINMAKSDLSTTVPTISGGTARNNGGNVILRGTAPVMNMSYGVITGGNSGLNVNKGTLNLSGTARITGNTKYNILLDSGNTLNATDLAEGAAFGVTMAATTGKFTAGTQDGFFTADNSDLLVVKKTDGLYLAKAVAKTGETRYASVQEAVNNTTSYVQLITDVTEDVELSGTLYLDLNGKTLTGNITGTGTLYGMDSATDTYTAGGRITGTVSCEVEQQFKTDITGAVRRYMAISDETGYTFNRFYIGITHMNVKPGADGVGYKATIAGNDAVLAQIEGYGYKLWITEDKVATATKSGTGLANMTTVTARVQNFDVETYGETPINGTVFIELKNGTVIESSVSAFTLRDMLETVSANAGSYTDTQLSAVKAMVARFSNAMADWNIDALK